MRLADLDPQQFVEWLRHAAPYINAHRGRTFVIAFPGAAAQPPQVEGLVHDLAVLASLGARLVLVPGARPQVEARLARRGLEPVYAAGSTGLRITDAEALECVRDAVGEVRTTLEARLSTAVAPSPMAGLRLRVVSGNVVTARPVGVRDGIDHLYTGEVRRVDIQALTHEPEAGPLALNEIGRVTLRTTAPLIFDGYARNRHTGSFVLVDEVSHQTVAAGMIEAPPVEPPKPEFVEYAI